MTPWLNDGLPLPKKDLLKKMQENLVCVFSTVKLTIAPVASGFIWGEQRDCFVKDRMSHAHRIELSVAFFRLVYRSQDCVVVWWVSSLGNWNCSWKGR